MALPERIQICPTCGNENDITQTSWQACCLSTFDFGGTEIGLKATIMVPEDLPARFGFAEVQLFLRRWMQDSNGMICLTARCWTIGELDAQIADLRRDLREMRKQARQVLAFRPERD